MKNFNRILFVVALQFWALILNTGVGAQVLSDTLTEINVKGIRKQVSNDDRINVFSPGQKVRTIDSLILDQYQFQSIANLLSQQVPVFVRSYGVNNLATLNFRGASAAQSQVYWNGIPIQNAALGIADVSLLPVSVVSKVNVVYGSSSALWGSGNVGGALLLENERAIFREEPKANYSVGAMAGSFGQYQLSTRASASNRKWFLNANVFAQTAKNDFGYSDKDTTLRMENSSLRSGGGLLNIAYKANEKNVVGFTGWYQQYFREIPRALFEPFSVKNQRDESIRLLSEWNRKGIISETYAKLSYIRDDMQYADSAIALRTQNVTNQVYAESGIKMRMKQNRQLLVFVPVQLSWIERRLQAEDTRSQTKIALAASYNAKYFKDRLNLAMNARGEMINDLSVFLPGASASFTVNNALLLRANIQRSFRVPTLNELYYTPGGNEKLKPEKGWNVDAGYTIRLSTGKMSFHQDVAVFNRVIEDWILWFGGSIWTPHNIATVHSRGIETEHKLQWQTRKWKWHLGINSSYVLATTVESYIPYDGSVNKQIPNTPRYSGQGNVGVTYRGLYLNYNHTYTGYRFVTTDESQFLEPYSTGNLQGLYTLYFKQFPLQVTAQVNNIWNARYAVVNARPMPGINWMLGLRFSFN